MKITELVRRPSQQDATLIYCPYIPLMISGTKPRPSISEPVVGFMTRYDYVPPNKASSPDFKLDNI